jgi:hypothetical protein
MQPITKPASAGFFDSISPSTDYDEIIYLTGAHRGYLKPIDPEVRVKSGRVILVCNQEIEDSVSSEDRPAQDVSTQGPEQADISDISRFESWRAHQSS